MRYINVRFTYLLTDLLISVSIESAYMRLPISDQL